MTPQEYQEKIQEIYRRAYEDAPGLEGFRRTKKTLLLLAMALFAVQKLLDVLAVGGGWAFLAGLAGLIIPAIFVLAAWRGGWKLALVLLIPSGMGLVSLFTEWIPALTTGSGYPPLFYADCAVVGLLSLTLSLTAFWLIVPGKNREYGDRLNRVHEELIQLSKVLAQDPRRGGGDSPQE